MLVSGMLATMSHFSWAAAQETGHVPPPPPQSELNLPHQEMMDLMQMDDRAMYGRVMLHQFEWRDADEGDVLGIEGNAHYGGDYHKLWTKFELERTGGTTEHGNAELLWDRVIASWWSLQTGVRHDFGLGPSRDWAAFGVSGLAPYWFEVEATAYLGSSGRTALRANAEYEWLLTQRLVLQPEFEVYWYGKNDDDRHIGSGVSQAEFGLRLRYEIRREVAPYIGILWTRACGDTTNFARQEGDDASEVSAIAGIRVWF